MLIIVQNHPFSPDISREESVHPHACMFVCRHGRSCSKGVVQLGLAQGQRMFISYCSNLNLAVAESSTTYMDTGARADLYNSDKVKGAMHFFDAAGEATWVIINPSTGAQVPSSAPFSCFG